MPKALQESLEIWCLLDGKAGHQNQVLGFAEAIQRLSSANIHRVELSGWNRGVWSLLHLNRGALPTMSPDLIVGAGHATHIPMCSIRQTFGGKSVVLMKPSLPLACFDFCFVPDVHRLKSVPANVILTKGVLNRIRPTTEKSSTQGLLLIGGPSAHYRWDEDAMLRQVKSVLKHRPDESNALDLDWTVAVSRRTPKSFTELLGGECGGVQIVEPDAVGPDWLLGQLATAGVVWVSEDSVSMTYEALSSGGAVGILQLKRHRNSRVTDCIDTLVNEQLVTPWSRWMETGELFQTSESFCEAERCATELLLRAQDRAARAA